MSYILEALKKSQAERQLGELPTIHAPQVQLQGNSTAGVARRAPAKLALGGMSAAVIAVLWWWQPWQLWQTAAPAAAPVSAPAPALAVTALPAAVPAAAAAAAAVPAAPIASPAAAQPAPARAPAMAALAPAPRVEPAPLPAAKREATPAPAPASASAPVAASPSPAPALPVDEAVPAMRDLPEPIQRQIPPIAIGGYIYSKNPSDRLLLIDKVLRHEGEELAPGLVLEKLQPKAAIFSFKGYRYRVPY